MSLIQTEPENPGLEVSNTYSNCDNPTTLIYGLPSLFTSEILYDGPKRCIVKSNVGKLSPDSTPNKINGGHEATGGIAGLCHTGSFSIPHPHNLTDVISKENRACSQNNGTKESCGSVAHFSEHELSDIPLSPNSEDKMNFDVSDISKQLTLLSPFSGKKFATIRSESNYIPMMSSLLTGNSDRVRSLDVLQNGTLHPKRSTVTMPTVEDGLSSGSYPSSPCSTSKSRIKDSTFDMRSLSGSPDSVTDIYCGRPTVNCCSGSLDGEHLLNPAIIQDISNDIMDIKRTLDTSDHTKTYTPSCEQKAVNALHVSKSTEQNTNPRTDRVNGCHCSEMKTESKHLKMPHNKNISTSSHTWDELKNQDKEKHIVQATVECTDAGTFDQVSCNGTDIKNNILESPTNSCSHKLMHHWTFPAQVHTVYSSSEDENSHKSSSTKSFSNKPQITSQNKSDKERITTFSSTPSSSSFENSQQKNQFNASTSPSNPGMVTNKSNPKITTRTSVNSDEIYKSSTSRHSDRQDGDFDSDEDTAQLLDKQYQADKQVYIPELKDKSCIEADRQRRVREVSVRHPEQPDVLIHGLLFRAQYMGSTQILCNKQSTRMSRMLQAQEIVNRIKAPDDESHPSVTVELFVSTERIMILNSNLEDILIDHVLRTVSYIADIGDLFVLMSRRLDPSTQSEEFENYPTSNNQNNELKEISNYNANNNNHNNNANSNSPEQHHSVIPATSNISKVTKSTTIEKLKKPIKMICHVLESTEAQLIAQTVGHAFQLAYLDFLRENGVEDLGIIKQLDYDDVLKQQEIFCDELSLFCDKDNHKEVTIPKQKGESLGVVIVESGWGSLLPTALLANMHPTGPAARCGQLNIGNQIVAVNGQSLVGLPLLTCQQIIKNCRQCTVVKLMIINCPPVVEVLIRRPSLNYQLGFSVQDGVICSLLRGGIAERGGIRVDHRIIEINGESVVAVSHEKIVQLLATSVGEIHIRTMPTSVFRLLTGQIIPRYI
ncbi:unnamed protein product [Schistosoma turkestanicum]|nr:unnamed protein product [Schistosoma turkestanicum]